MQKNVSTVKNWWKFGFYFEKTETLTSNGNIFFKCKKISSNFNFVIVTIDLKTSFSLKNHLKLRDFCNYKLEPKFEKSGTLVGFWFFCSFFFGKFFVSIIEVCILKFLSFFCERIGGSSLSPNVMPKRERERWRGKMDCIHELSREEHFCNNV